MHKLTTDLPLDRQLHHNLSWKKLKLCNGLSFRKVRFVYLFLHHKGKQGRQLTAENKA